MLSYFQDILTFCTLSRRAGTTTLLKKIATEHDCYIVVNTTDEIRNLYRDVAERCISAAKLKEFCDSPSFVKKPMLFDSGVVRELCNHLVSATTPVPENKQPVSVTVEVGGKYVTVDIK